MKSKVDSNWDVMKYKYHYELEHQWDLKKRFIDAHKKKYPEDRLICLAQLFCNVHFMGCSYEDNIMKLIGELSEGIAEKNQKWEKQSFVTASDAIEARVKDRLNPLQPGLSNQQNVNHQQEGQSRVDPPKSNFVNFVQSAAGESSVGSRKRPASPVVERYFENKILRTFSEREIKQEISQVVSQGPFGVVVVFQNVSDTESPVAVVERTAAAAQMALNYSIIPASTDNLNCKITLGGMFLSSAQGTNRKVAKEAACRLAIDHLKETSFTIVVKTAFVRDGAEVDRELNLPSEAQAQAAASVDKSLLDTNIGSRLLKMMGWSGGGLGKDSQGIEEPVTASGTVDRKGLGLNEGVEFSRKIGKLLQDYIANSDNKDMVFASDFTKEERKTIHEACRKYKLKTKSFGNEPNRQLVVSKRVRPLEIVEDLMKAGWETEKYKLLPPKSYLDRFTI
ncbi:Protein of unknown function (DUF3469) [Nesidiocoris tenuis]|uniref:NF-kappa-B-repressing factor n=1 Tax=Nesidiocoris tenuis TaxID=355587 RepID=A0ABN7ASV7_9HEMI|nr:Protein of unknown function (DUF3469) [Nesidiocoris tenuis]